MGRAGLKFERARPGRHSNYLQRAGPGRTLERAGPGRKIQARPQLCCKLKTE